MKTTILLLDAPWPYFGDQKKMGAAGNHYQSMSMEELEALPIRAMLEDKAAVLMWATGPKLPEAIQLIKAWGLHYRNVAYVWVKTNGAGNVIGAQGPPATLVKQNAEYLLFATTNKDGRPFPVLDFKQKQIVFAGKKEHSAKPRCIHTKIEELAGPETTKVELFARQPREGWVTLGDGIDGRDIREAIEEYISCSSL